MTYITSKRLFSTNENIDYQQYMNNKKGIAILHNRLSFGQKKIQRFISYQEFLILTRTFFLYSQRHIDLFKSPFTISQAKRSQVSFHRINEHLAVCNFCLHAKNPNDFLTCREIQNILYPYGHYLGNHQEIYYPSTLDLTKWCQPCNKPINQEEHIEENYFNNDTAYFECDDCPQASEDDVSPLFHKPNCECCKKIIHPKSPDSNKKMKNHTPTNPNHCQMCMNTTSLFMKK